MEVALVFSPDDYGRYLKDTGRAPGDRRLAAGYACSGSSARRNIELIYQKAEAASVSVSLEDAVDACLGRRRRVQHVLLCSGFYVLHGRCGTMSPGIAPGSCETDGPLGVLALLRAFALRGVRASLFCDAHNGPVLKAGYCAMLDYYRALDADVARELERNSRCLPFVSDAAPPPSCGEEIARKLESVFPGEACEPSSPQSRAVCVATRLAAAVEEAWAPPSGGDASAATPCPMIDCLFALERLGAPYRNIRGRDISEHTEPIDALWPTAGEAALEGNAGSAAAMLRLREIAGVTADALTLGIGDGGNEVGMGKVVHLPGIADLAPPGADFVALAENGCHRTCDHLVLSTVSNWGGAAFEMSANLLFEPAVDYLAAMRAGGKTLADVEQHVLGAITSPQVMAVDGIDFNREQSVDGMAFDPHHRQLYDLLWRLTEDGLGTGSGEEEKS